MAARASSLWPEDEAGVRGEPRWIRKVRHAVEEHRLLAGCSTVLVGVSGGADSVALLVALRRLCGEGPPRLHVAHFNHGIRGRAAAADEVFVRRLAERLGLACSIGRADVPRQARCWRLSMEAAAREARLRWFSRVAKRVGADRIALAHTRDDQAETVLLRLLRGAGTEGLSAMSRDTVVRGLRIIRPMLDLSREEIRRALAAEGWRWREDATNRRLRYLRNRVRLRWLPAIERELGRDVRATLARVAEILAAEDEVLASLAERAAQRRIGSRGFALRGVGRIAPALQRRMLRLWMRGAGVPEGGLTWSATELVRALATGAVGTCVALAGGWSVRRDGDWLRLVRRAVTRNRHRWHAVRLPLPGGVRPSGADWTLEAVPDRGWQTDGEHGVGVLPAVAWIRRDMGAEFLTVRPWRPGDAFRPLGGPGTAKVSDLLTNEKVPHELRSGWPVVLCGDDIVWLPGYRIAHSVRVQRRGDPSWRLTLRRCLESDRAGAIVGPGGARSASTRRL